MSLGFEITDEMKDLAEKKCIEIVDSLEEIEDIKMKALILHTVIETFRELSGINICKHIKVMEEEDRYYVPDDEEKEA